MSAIIEATAFGSQTTQQTVAVGPRNRNMQCPHCKVFMETKIEGDPSMQTHAIAVLLMSICCCCLPYCLNVSFK